MPHQIKLNFQNMSKKHRNRESSNKNEKDTLVFTTSKEGNSFFNDIFINNNDEEVESSSKSSMKVRVTLDRKNRGGKEVTLIMGLELKDDELQELAKTLKSKCGVGGAAKDGEIIVQGNHVQKVIDLLKKEGFPDVKKTGG